MQTEPNNLRVAIVGCGQIADAHLQEIGKLDGAEVVAVCDVHQDLADQAAARFQVPAACTDMERMIRVERPDIVHITTPAHTHAALGMRALAGGCHVYIEKPFTVDADEADKLLAVAESSGRQVCVGHDQLFDPMWINCRQRVAAGEIGDVVHVDSVLGYPLSGQFGAQVAADPNHWVRRLPGGLFQNTISHPLYRITDFLSHHDPHIRAHWFSRNTFGFPTDLRVEFLGDEVTGSLVFDTRMEAQRVTRVYGTRGCLVVDFDAQTVHRNQSPQLPGAFGKLQRPFSDWCQATSNLTGNLFRFLRSDIHYFAGMRNLFESFYESIRSGSEPPFPYTEIKRVTRLMDTIFEQCRARDDMTDASRTIQSDVRNRAPETSTV